MHGQKSVIRNIMEEKLPPDERKQFHKLVDGTSIADFFKLLPAYFTDHDIQAGIAEYLMNGLNELETDTGARVDAVLTIYGRQFNYRNFNEVSGV